jgi:cytochrome c
VKLLAAVLALAMVSCDPQAPEAQKIDPALGERAYQKCYSCHELAPGRNDLTGPTLHRILGRRVAAEDFDYSPAMKQFAEREPRWTRELLGRFISGPEAVVAGTSMTFPGIADEAERKALIDYLDRQTSASAANFP